MSGSESHAEPVQFTVRGLLVFTAGVAFLFGAFQLPFPIALPMATGITAALYSAICGTRLWTSIWVCCGVAAVVGLWMCLQIFAA